jgi:hypothetical protein
MNKFSEQSEAPVVDFACQMFLWSHPLPQPLQLRKVRQDKVHRCKYHPSLIMISFWYLRQKMVVHTIQCLRQSVQCRNQFRWYYSLRDLS